MVKKRIIAIVAAFVMSLCGVALAACADDSGKKYVVSYHANGGYFDSGVLTVYEKVEADGYARGKKIPNNTDSSLEFLGWALEKSSKTVIELSEYSITKDTDFYAVWGTEEPPTAQHTVIFYYNYTGSPTEKFKTTTVDDGAAVTEPSPAPSRGEAYPFEGWYTSAKGDTKYNFGNPVTKDLSLYAHWGEPSSEPVITGIEIVHNPKKTSYVAGQTFDDDGLVVQANYSAGKNPETLTKGVDYTVSKPNMSKIGPQVVMVSYDNDGMHLTAEFTITIEAKAVTAVLIGGDLTNKQQEVGAVFNPAGLTFKAKYNDGDVKDLKSSEVTFASAMLNKDGTFKKDGEAQITATYDDVTSSTEITVTVYVPEETKYNVEFFMNNTAYANNITGAPSIQRVVENATAKQPTAPKLDGFVFKGWYTEAACENAFSFTRAITKDTKLYAKWEAIEYLVEYKLSGGTNVSDNKATYTVSASGEFETVALKNPSKGHNVFGGWFFDNKYETSTTELSYSNVTEYAVKNADDTYTVTLYAKFTPEVYDIVYEWGAANGTDYQASFVEGYTAPVKYTYGVGVELPDAEDVQIIVLKTGEAVEFNFLGWYLKSDVNKTHITSISSTVFDKKTIVADIVQAAAYNVTYDYNYTGSTATVKKVLKDDYASALSPAPTRAGYTFDKWYTTKERETEFAFATTKITQNTTVYAGWTPIEYTISYIGLPAGATNGNSATYTVENGDVTLNDPTFLPEGYRFFGWYSDNKYKTKITEIVPADIANADDKVITVYANCNNKYTVTFNENILETAVTDMPEDITGVVYGEGVEKPNDPACENHTFGGWYIDKECTTEWVFIDGEGTVTLVKPTEDNNYKCEIFAKWIENPESGVYLFGTPNGSNIHHADIADYKVTVTEEGGVKTYAIGNLDLKAGTSFKLINYTKATGDITWITAATSIVVHPQAGMTVIKTSDGNYKVDAVTIDNAKWTLTVSAGRADFTLEIAGGYIGLRAPNSTTYDPDLAYAEMPASDSKAFIAGNFTNDFKLYNTWSSDSKTITAAKVEKDGTTYYVFQGVKLNKHDEFKIVHGSAQSAVKYVETTGEYNIVYNATTKAVSYYETKALVATFKGVVYEGKTITSDNLTVTHDDAEVEDYIIIAEAAASGENTAKIVYLAGGAITSVTYTATADSIKSVEITTAPQTLGYYVGGTLDFADIVLKITYNSGDELEASADYTDLLNRITFEINETYYADNAFILAGSDIEVTVKFDGTAAGETVKINVYNKLTSIVVGAPTTTEYVAGVSEELDYDGLVVTAYYNNTTAESEDAVTAVISIKSEENANGYTIDATAYEYETVGDYDITIALTEVFGTLTSSASGKFTVSVVAPKVVSVAAADDSELTKTIQLIGSTFDASGLKFVGTKNDKDSTEVAIAAADMKFEITVGGETATNEAGLLVKSGTATVTATYTVGNDELTATFETAVTFEIANKLTSIEATQPTKTSFPQNGTFDKTGISVTAKYNEGIDGATEATAPIDLEKCTVTANLATVGETAGVITVSYTENGVTETKTVNVEVTEPKVVSVEVLGTLTQKKYYVGDTFNPAGLTFEATYDNGTTKDLEASELTFNGGNAFATAGTALTVSIVYNTEDGEIVATSSVPVTANVLNKLTSIVVTTQPTAPHAAGWVVGDSTESLNTVAVTAYYNNTTAESENPITKAVTATTNAQIINMSTIGKKTITATYNEPGVGTQMQSAQCTIEIEVIAKVMTKLEYEGDVIEQYYNREFDPDGLTFYKVYNNETREAIVGTTGITFSSSAFEADDTTFAEYGENITVTATYDTFTVNIEGISVKDTRMYKVTYNGNLSYTVTVPKTTYYQRNTTIPTSETPVCYGFTFVGWYTEAACTNAWVFGDEGTKVDRDRILYANWTANTYTVRYAGNLGLSSFDYIATNNVFAPTALGVPTTTEVGKEFVGWTYSKLTTDPTAEQIFTELTQARLIPEYMVGDAVDGYTLTLKAVYEKSKITVTFDSNGGSYIVPQSVEYEGKATKPETDPTKDYYTFEGWYTTSALDTEFDFANTQITEATTIYAKWTAIEYDVIYNVNEANGEAAGDNPEKYNADQGSVTLNSATTAAEGKVFLEWQDAEGETVTALTTSLINAEGKIVLTAVFGNAKKYTVTFNTNGGSEITSQSIVSGKTATKPADPSKTHYTFAGWYTTENPAEGAAQYNFATPVTAALILYAKWTPVQYTVTFDSNGGSAVEAQDVDYLGKASKPTNPEKPNYTFKGWFTDENPAEGAEQFDFVNTPITGAITLYAKWEKNPIKVTVDYNYDGQAGFDITVPDTGLIAEPVAPNARAGYSFVGWYDTATPAEGDLPFDFGTVITTNKTLYAKWKTVNGLYVGTTLLKEFVVANEDEEYAVKFVKIEGTTAKPVAIRIYVNGTAQTDATNVKTGSASGFTSSNGVLTATASGIYTIYYRYAGDNQGLYIVRNGDISVYVEPTLKNGDGVYVGNTPVGVFVINENDLNQVMARNVEITTSSAEATVTVTLKYNGTTATIAYLEMNDPTLTIAHSGNTLTMYAGTYNFYYNYAKKGEDTGDSHNNAANRLWIDGTQTGGEISTLGDYYVVGSMTGWGISEEHHLGATGGSITIDITQAEIDNEEDPARFKVFKSTKNDEDEIEPDWDTGIGYIDVTVGYGYAINSNGDILIKQAGTYTIKLVDGKIEITSDNVILPVVKKGVYVNDEFLIDLSDNGYGKLKAVGLTLKVNDVLTFYSPYTNELLPSELTFVRDGCSGKANITVVGTSFKIKTAGCYDFYYDGNADSGDKGFWVQYEVEGNCRLMGVGGDWTTGIVMKRKFGTTTYVLTDYKFTKSETVKCKIGSDGWQSDPNRTIPAGTHTVEYRDGEIYLDGSATPI